MMDIDDHDPAFEEAPTHLLGERLPAPHIPVEILNGLANEDESPVSGM